MIGSLLDLLFPSKCACCGRVLERWRVNPCPACAEDLPLLSDDQILRRGPYGLCAVAFRYEGGVRDAIRACKFHGRQSALRALAPYLVQAAAEHLSGQFDAVTYVPVSPKRLRERGYDQARLLADAMARHWDTRAEATLRKVRHTKAQSSLKDAAARRQNIDGAYTVLSAERVIGRRFLLVDDVVTTGSTMAAAAEALRSAGAASVVCAALAAPDQGANQGDHAVQGEILKTNRELQLFSCKIK